MIVSIYSLSKSSNCDDLGCTYFKIISHLQSLSVARFLLITQSLCNCRASCNHMSCYLCCTSCVWYTWYGCCVVVRASCHWDGHSRHHYAPVILDCQCQISLVSHHCHYLSCHCSVVTHYSSTVLLWIVTCHDATNDEMSSWGHSYAVCLLLEQFCCG